MPEEQDPQAVGESLPEPLDPPIAIGAPNEPILLYEGSAKLQQQAGSGLDTEVRVLLSWLPSPHLRVEVPNIPSGFHPQLADFALTLSDGADISSCVVSGLRATQEGASLTAIINGRVVRPRDAAVSHASFLVPNFKQPNGQWTRLGEKGWSATRNILTGSGWIITLDRVPDHRERIASLEANSGYGVTQVGRLELEGGKPFSVKDAMQALDAVAWHVSFACGRWTGPCFARGFDSKGDLVWEVWNTSRTVSYGYRRSWMDTNHRQHFEDVFPGFFALWCDEYWGEIVRAAIHWYIESNAQAGSVEGSIILAQTALELLVSTILVETQGWLSTDGHEKLAASDRIRLLFVWAGIPIGIPSELSELSKLAKADNWADTSTAMTMIRNTITHPTKKNREKFGKHPSTARTETWVLGLWNLELCLLKLFGYSGTYANRIRQRFLGEVEPVPWSGQSRADGAEKGTG